MSYIADLLFQGFMFALTFGTYNAYQNQKKIDLFYKNQNENMKIMMNQLEEDRRQQILRLNESNTRIKYNNNQINKHIIEKTN
jgi:hypothetical protein